MGVKINDKVHTPKSTGKFATPAGPMASDHAYGNNPASNAQSTPNVADHKVGHGPDAVVRFPTSSEPVSVSVGWVGRNTDDATEVPARAVKRPEPQAKVVKPPAKRAPRKSARKVTTKTK